VYEHRRPGVFESCRGGLVLAGESMKGGVQVVEWREVEDEEL